MVKYALRKSFFTCLIKTPGRKTTGCEKSRFKCTDDKFQGAKHQARNVRMQIFKGVNRPQANLRNFRVLIVVVPNIKVRKVRVHIIRERRNNVIIRSRREQNTRVQNVQVPNFCERNVQCETSMSNMHMCRTCGSEIPFA